MTKGEILWAVIAGLAVNECCDVSPWAGRALVRWSARLRYTDPARAYIRAEELPAYIDACPGKLFKLGAAVGFAVASLAVAACRVIRIRPSALDKQAPTAVRTAAAEALGDAVRGFADIRVLPPRSRRQFRSLTATLQKLLRYPAEELEMSCSEHLLAAAASVSEVLVDDRDEGTAALLVQAANRHADRFASDHPEVVRLRYAGAYAALQLGRYVEAEYLLRGLLPDCVRVFGPDHRYTFETRRQTGWSLQEQGRLDDAEAVFLDLSADMERLPGPAVAQRLHVGCMFSWILFRQGRLREAEDCYRQVIADRQNRLGPLHADTLDACHSLAQVILAQVTQEQGDLTRALVEFQGIAAHRRNVLGAAHADTLESRKFAALVSARLGRRGPAKAGRELRRILAIQTKKLGPDHPNTRHTQDRLAMLRRASPA